MDDAKRKEIQKWLIKSQHDLGSARLLMESNEKYLDMAVYHCQQAAEKAIKAYLVYRDVVFEKTHNLVALLFQCASLDSQFMQWLEVAKILTPYSTEFRYPRDVMEPEENEAKEAYLAAKAFVDFVIKTLPNELKI